MTTRFEPGDVVDITIKGVRVAEERPDGTVVIRCDDDKVHGVWPMPPQAAIKRTDLHNPIDAATISERISKALAFLDGLEGEMCLDPYVAAGVRNALGLPPRNWPPQPGDVWADDCPFTPLWFAQRNHAKEGAGDAAAGLVMTCVDGGPGGAAPKTPDALLKSSYRLTLAYRQAGADHAPNDEGDND